MACTPYSCTNVRNQRSIGPIVLLLRNSRWLLKGTYIQVNLSPSQRSSSSQLASKTLTKSELSAKQRKEPLSDAERNLRSISLKKMTSFDGRSSSPSLISMESFRNRTLSSTSQETTEKSVCTGKESGRRSNRLSLTTAESVELQRKISLTV